jgi:hypothetical protein
VIHVGKGTFVRISKDATCPRRSGRRGRRGALSVAALEQVLGSCREALGAEHLEAERVGEPVGGIERGADRERVLDLLGLQNAESFTLDT